MTAHYTDAERARLVVEPAHSGIYRAASDAFARADSGAIFRGRDWCEAAAAATDGSTRASWHRLSGLMGGLISALIAIRLGARP